MSPEKSRSSAPRIVAGALLSLLPAAAHAQWAMADHVSSNHTSYGSLLNPAPAPVVAIDFYPPWIDPYLYGCSPPTAEQCLSDETNPADPHQGYFASTCGQEERDKWASGTGACAAHVQAQGGAAVDAVDGTYRTVYLPPSARRNGSALGQSKSIPYTYAHHYSNGMLGTYAGILQHGKLAALRFGQALMALPSRLAWASNGTAVRSCEEYAYERYYDYSYFEDAVSVAGGDARAVFDAAYAPGAIGDRGRHGMPIASKSGNTHHWLTWEGTHPKNTYFAFEPRYPIGFEDKAYAMDADIMGRINVAPRPHHDFAWHHAMSQALAGTPDDLLYAMDERQADFADMLRRRDEIYAVWAQAHGEFVRTISECNVQIDPGHYLPNPDIYINPNPMLELNPGLYLPILAPVQLPNLMHTMSAGGGGSPAMNGIAAIDQIHAGADYLSIKEDCTDLPPLNATCSGYGYGTVQEYAKRVTQCLKVIDEEIEAELRAARDQGCMDPWNVTACDWSPRLLVRELHGHTLYGQNEAYAKCVRWTGDNFADTSMIRNTHANEIWSSQSDMTSSTEHVDAYFSDFRKALAEINFPIDPVTSRPIFGARATDTGDMGNDMFGVKYGYDVGWRLENLDQPGLRMCNAEVDVRAAFNARASIFGVDKHLVNADNYLLTDKVSDDLKRVSYKVYLVLMDKEFLNLPPGSIDVPMNGLARPFPAASAKESKRFTLVELKKTFPIGPIPVTIAAGATGEVGLEMSIDGELGWNCPRPWENPNGVGPDSGEKDVLYVGARGTARPFAGVKAYASAAVDIIIASAGVRADLTLLELSVPFSVSVGGGITPDVEPHIKAGTKLDLVIEALSGRVSVFIDTLFGKILDETLFRWDGLRVTQNIVDESWDMHLFKARRKLTN